VLLPLLGFRTHTPTPPTFAQAVAQWQRANGLTVDGILGPNTWRTMRRALDSPSRPARPSTRPAARPNVPSVPLGSLTLKSRSDPRRTTRMYRFTPEDLLVTARMLEGENRGRETLETAGVMWSMLNLYAFIQHHRRSFPTFAALLYKYSSPLFPGRSLRNKPWSQLRPSSRRMAVRGLQGRLPNPIGNATDFANPYIYFRRRNGRAPSRSEWINYIASHTKNYLKWIGPIEGIQQYRRNTFYINKRLLNVPTGVVDVR